MKVCQGLAEAGQPTTLVVPGRPDTAAPAPRGRRSAHDVRTVARRRDRAVRVPVSVHAPAAGFVCPVRRGARAPPARRRGRIRAARLDRRRAGWRCGSRSSASSTTSSQRRPAVPVPRSRTRPSGRVRLHLRGAGPILLDRRAGAPRSPSSSSRMTASTWSGSRRRWTATARQRLNLPAQPIVCHAGHLYPGRGVETLLEAAARLPEVLFLFVGGTAADVDPAQDARERLAERTIRGGCAERGAALVPLCGRCARDAVHARDTHAPLHVADEAVRVSRGGTAHHLIGLCRAARGADIRPGGDLRATGGRRRARRGHQAGPGRWRARAANGTIRPANGGALHLGRAAEESARFRDRSFRAHARRRGALPLDREP